MSQWEDLNESRNVKFRSQILKYLLVVFAIVTILPLSSFSEIVMMSSDIKLPIDKTPSASNIIFAKTIGSSFREVPKGIFQTDDGYVFGGFISKLLFQPTDFLLGKLDPLGNYVLGSTFGGESFDSMYTFAKTMDGGFFLLGDSQSMFEPGGSSADFRPSRAFMIRTDALLNISWASEIRVGVIDDVCESSDGSFNLVGSLTTKFSGNDLCIAKLGPDGRLIWAKEIATNGANFTRSIIRTADGNLAAVGDSLEGNNGRNSALLIKCDTTGKVIWARRYLSSSYDITINKIIATSDEGFALTGSTNKFAGDGADTIFLMKTDSAGNILWQKNMGSGTAYSVTETPDGGFIVSCGAKAGKTTGNDAVLLKTDINGSLTNTWTYAGSKNDEFVATVSTNDNCYISIGNTESSGGGDLDIMVLKFKDPGLLPAYDSKSGLAALNSDLTVEFAALTSNPASLDIAPVNKAYITVTKTR